VGGAGLGGVVELVAGVGRGRAHAGAVRAGLARRAGVVVVARGAVRLVRVRAHAGRRVAGARHVALVERRAGDGRGRAPAGAVLAGLARRRSVERRVGEAVRLVRGRAHAGRRVAGGGQVSVRRGLPVVGGGRSLAG